MKIDIYPTHELKQLLHRIEDDATEIYHTNMVLTARELNLILIPIEI